MKTILFIFAGLLLAAPAPAGDSAGELFLNYTYKVKPDKIAEFEGIMKEWKAISQKHKVPKQMHLYSNDRMEYDLLVPLKNFAGLDQLIADIDGLMKKMGPKKWDALEKRERKTFDSMRISVMRRLPKLSYRPEKPRLPGKQAQAYRADFLYLKPAAEQKAHVLFNKLKKLATKKNLSDGWDTYVGSIGWSTPVLIVIARGKDSSDIRQNNSRPWNSPDITSLLRKRRTVDGRHRPELSNPAYR